MKRGKSMQWLYSICLVLGIIGFSGFVYSVYEKQSRPQPDWNNTPPPTSRVYTQKDIVGTWGYAASSGTMITITFNADGTFVQKIRTLPPQAGHWAISPSAIGKERGRGFRPGRLNLYDVLMRDDGGWKADPWVEWEMIDSALRPGAFAIAGADNKDPDSREEFVKILTSGGVTSAPSSAQTP